MFIDGNQVLDNSLTQDQGDEKILSSEGGNDNNRKMTNQNKKDTRRKQSSSFETSDVATLCM